MAQRKKLALHWRILIGLALGVVVGLLVNRFWTPRTWASLGVNDPASYIGAGSEYLASKAPDGPNADANVGAALARQARHGVEFAGSLFVNGLRFIAVPIVLFSLIVGVASLNDIRRLGRIGGKTMGIFLITGPLAICIGLAAANLLGPGRGFDIGRRDAMVSAQADTTQATIAGANDSRAQTPWDMVLNLVPTNPFEAMASGNTLQVVVVALLVGVGVTMIPRDKAAPLIAFFDAMTDVIIKIVELVLVLAPYAVFALIVKVTADLGVEVLVSLLKYCAVVVLGLAIMLFIVYPAFVVALTPVGYRRFFRAVAPAQLLAFSSSSSGATLPVTMECCEKRLGAGEDVTAFVVPVGATVNMDGTALYQAVAAVFIAQLYGMDLSLGQQLQIVLTATLTAIGTAAVPGVGIITLVIVLESVNIPVEGIAVILGVDRILDMCRTCVNVTGDCMATAVVASSEGSLLSEEEVNARLAAEERRGLDEHQTNEPRP